MDTFDFYENPRFKPKNYFPPAFDVGEPLALEYLKEEGYVVFKNVLSLEENKEAISLMWKWLEKVCPDIRRDNWKTWDSWPKTSLSGILYSDGIGQSEFLWYLREKPKVRQIFSNIWNGEQDLTCSFDGCTIVRPVDVSNWIITELGLHLDQNISEKPGFQCVQGLVNLIDSKEEDGGFVCIPKSHLVAHQLFLQEPFKSLEYDFAEIPMLSNSDIWTQTFKDLYPIKLCIDQNCMLLWDSRTIHGTIPPSPVRNISSPKYTSIRRVVAYICMLPTSRTEKEEVFQQRQKAVEKGYTTTHWPNEYHTKEMISPKHYTPPTLSPVQLELISPHFKSQSKKD